MHSNRFVPHFATTLMAACAIACARTPDTTPRTAMIVVDAFGDTQFAGPAPMRIVSLNPATTELVFALGAGSRMVGRTRWDSYPDSALLVPNLGDGMRPNVEAVMAAKPDLVLLYSSQENRPARDAFRRAGVRTFTQRFDRIADFERGIMELGRIIGDTVKAQAVRDSVSRTLAHARELTAALGKPRVMWPVWEAPLMVIGRGSFLNELLDAAGASNIFADIDAPSPQVTLEEAVKRDPDIVLVGSTNGPMQRDAKWRALRAVREGHVIVYDTAIVSRPGVRLGEAAMHLAKLLHAELRQ